MDGYLGGSASEILHACLQPVQDMVLPKVPIQGGKSFAPLLGQGLFVALEH